MAERRRADLDAAFKKARILYTSRCNRAINNGRDTLPWQRDKAGVPGAASATAFKERGKELHKTLMERAMARPLLCPHINPFALDEEDLSRQHKRQNTYMARYKGKPIELARDILFREIAGLSHLDKVRRAYCDVHSFIKGWLSNRDIEDIIRRYDKGANREGLQSEIMEYITEAQRSTCDVIWMAMFKLFYYTGGDKVWDTTSASQRRKLYRQIYKQMPLVIDSLIYSREGHTVDIITIHANEEDPTAKKFRRFCEYKFLRLCEATMYYRVWKFNNWKEPVYRIWKTIILDPTVERDLGITSDVMEVPAVPNGARGTNYRPEPIYSNLGSFAFSEDSF